MYIGVHVKYPLLLSDFNETWIFPTYFRKMLKYQISWKSFQREPSCSLGTDRQTDMTKLIVTFRNFTNAPNKFMLLFILYIFRALYIYLLYIIPTYCSYWHTIYVVVICNIHSPTCFSLDKPSSAGFNYKPKHVEECILQNSTTYILFISTFSHSLLSIQKSVISYRKNLWTTVYT
jgi:hypothetical protein